AQASAIDGMGPCDARGTQSCALTHRHHRVLRGYATSLACPDRGARWRSFHQQPVESEPACASSSRRNPLLHGAVNVRPPALRFAAFKVREVSPLEKGGGPNKGPGPAIATAGTVNAGQTEVTINVRLHLLSWMRSTSSPRRSAPRLPRASGKRRSPHE